MDDLKTIRAIKRRAIARIKTLINPYLYESGFVTGKIGEASRPLKLFPFPKPFRLDGEDIEGVTESGIITDSFGPGLVQSTFRDLDAAYLLKLEMSLKKHLPAKEV